MGPASGKCSIPASELKLTKTFAQYMEENKSFRDLIESGREICNGKEIFLLKHLLTWKPLSPRTSRPTSARLSMTSIRLPMLCLETCHKETIRREPSTGLLQRLL